MQITEQDFLDQLSRAARTLRSGQITLLVQMAEGMKKTIRMEYHPEGGVASELFADNFANRLLIHHAISAERFHKKSFEYAFQGAMQAAGRPAELADSATDPGADVRVGKVRFSLKSEGGKKISPGSITVSKLAEARWIRDDNKNPNWLLEGLNRFVIPRLLDYDHVLTLRAFDDRLSGEPAFRYDLVEIPVPLLQQMNTITVNDIRIAPGPSGGGSARVMDGKKHLFTVVFDGSVEKMRLSSLKVSECRPFGLHASWTIPVSPVALTGDEDENEG